MKTVQAGRVSEDNVDAQPSDAALIEGAVALAGDDHVEQHFAVRTLHHGADRDGQFEIFAHRAGAVITHAEAAVAGVTMRRVVIRQQRRHLRVGHQHDVAAVTAVAAVRSAQRLELLAMHRGAAVTTVTGLNMKDNAIDEAGHDSPLAVGRLGEVLEWWQGHQE